MDNKLTFDGVDRRLLEAFYHISMAAFGLEHDDDNAWIVDEFDCFAVMNACASGAELFEKLYAGLEFGVDCEDFLDVIDPFGEAYLKRHLGCRPVSDREELFLCHDQKKASVCRQNGWTMIDYDGWKNVEKIVGGPVTAGEYKALDSIYDECLVECNETNKQELETILGVIRRKNNKGVNK